MKRSTLVPGPHRMPPRTHRRTDLADLPGERPDVTTEAWVGWFERSLHEEPVESEPLEPVAVLEPSPEPEPEPVSEHPLVPEPVTGSPCVTTPEASAFPRRTGVLVAAAAAVVLALVAGTWWWQDRSEPDPTPRARQVEASSRPSAPPVPVDLPVGGRHTEVRVLASGDLDVQEWLRSPDGSVAYDRYQLTGSLQRDGTRALATLRHVDVGQSTERTIAVVGARVLALACASSSEDVPVPCGAEAGAEGWRLVGPAATPDAEVLVQLDLVG